MSCANKLKSQYSQVVADTEKTVKCVEKQIGQLANEIEQKTALLNQINKGRTKNFVIKCSKYKSKESISISSSSNSDSYKVSRYGGPDEPAAKCVRLKPNEIVKEAPSKQNQGIAGRLRKRRPSSVLKIDEAKDQRLTRAMGKLNVQSTNGNTPVRKPHNKREQK